MTSPSKVPAPSARKLWVFRLLAISLAVGLGLFAGEWGLRLRRAKVAASEQLAPGLIEPDPLLGWHLAANWEGEHRHADFSARYLLDEQGFRRTSSAGAAPAGGTVVVGDSFTFGFGVNQGETFVDRLNATAAGTGHFRNLGVPGYSTDQELLLIENRLRTLRPQRILLMVYVGNDLFDNLRSVPLQVRRQKPYFEPAASGLVLRNVPVPTGPVGPIGGNLTTSVLGPDHRRWPLLIRLEQRWQLLHFVGENFGWFEAPAAEFEARFAPAMNLFDLILGRFQQAARNAQAELVVGILTGRSHLVQPHSLSSGYQEYFRQAVQRAATAREIPVIDIAAALRARQDPRAGAWFFPNDGHLTAAGHDVVAGVLRAQLRPAAK